MLVAKTDNEPYTTHGEPLFSASSTVSLIGLSAYLTWSICRIIPTLFPHPQENAVQIIASTDIPHSIAYVLVLIAFGFFLFRNMERKHKRILAVALSIFLCLGTGLIYISGWNETIIPAGIWIGSIAIAAEMGLLLLWGDIYSTLSIKHCCINTAISYAGAFASCILIIQLNPLFCILMHSALPLASGFLLFVSYGEHPERDCPRKTNRLKHDSMKLPVKFLIGFAMLAFLQLLTSDLSEHMTSHTTEMNSLIGGLLASIATAVLAIAFPKKSDFGAIYRFFVPAIIICVVLVLIAEPGAPPYEIYAVAACWAFFRISTWVMWCFLSGKLEVSPFYMFAAGQIALSLGGIAEKLIKPALLTINDPVSTLVPTIIILALVTSSILLNERHVIELFGLSGFAGAQTAEAPEDNNPNIDHAASIYHLSQREQEIAKMLILGKTNSEIENELFIASSTLKTHLRNMYSKCGVHSKRDFISALLINEDEDT